MDRAPTSGSYQSTSPSGGLHLDLRLDIDSRGPGSPVLNKLSGDLWSANPDGSRGGFLRTFIAERLTIVASPLEVKGGMRYWKPLQGPPPEIVVREDSAGVVAEFTEPGGPALSFKCTKTSDSFRDVRVEADLCTSAKDLLSAFSYSTDAHPVRPPGLAPTKLTFESAMWQAGVKLEIRDAHGMIDDTDPEFESWTAAELQHAMAEHYSQRQSTWPRWDVWGLAATSYLDPLFAGLMFDSKAVGGDAGQERQAFAIFRRHHWFKDLAAAPGTAEHATALRKYFHTCIHELGHSFNMRHSFDKGRPDSLSWMNYDWKYDGKHGADSYWKKFEFQFDPTELTHLRHGNLQTVIQGGDPWGSGDGLGFEAPPGPPEPLEVILRSQPEFQLMEPVELELRVRNLSPAPVTVYGSVSPEQGNLTVRIQGPGGLDTTFVPGACHYREPVLRTLSPPAPDAGSDRISYSVPLTWGQRGFYFQEPGTYSAVAEYETPRGGKLVTPPWKLKVLPPDREIESLAKDFYWISASLSKTV